MDERDSVRGEAMARCRQLADDIKVVYGEAKDEGLAVKALKGRIKRRQKLREVAAIPAEFDIDETSQYDAQCAADDFAGTPMGAFMQREQAEQARNGNGEEPREDEEYLKRIGRGRPGDVIDQLAN